MWNPNSMKRIICGFFKYRFFFYLGYDIINGSIELIYRVDSLYGLGYLLRRSFYEKNIKDLFTI